MSDQLHRLVKVDAERDGLLSVIVSRPGPLSDAGSFSFNFPHNLKTKLSSDPWFMPFPSSELSKSLSKEGSYIFFFFFF